MEPGLAKWIFVSGASLNVPAQLRRSTGYPLKVSMKFFSGTAVPGGILLTTRSAGAESGRGRLRTHNAIVIGRASAGRAVQGTQTLFNCCRRNIFFNATCCKNGAWQMPCVRIEDRPRFQWRGLMLDVSRHFYETRLKLRKFSTPWRCSN